MKWDFAFRPKWVETLQNDWRQDVLQDAVAGETDGLAVGPPAMAFALASGVKPEGGPTP